MLKVGDLIEIPGSGSFYVPVTEISDNKFKIDIRNYTSGTYRETSWIDMSNLIDISHEDINYVCQSKDFIEQEFKYRLSDNINPRDYIILIPDYINYLPMEHNILIDKTEIKDPILTEDESIIELLTQLCNEYPNDMDLGRELRKLINKNIK